MDAEGRGVVAESPFRTLQYAHDAAAAGDTVYLLPGVYVEGEYADANHKNRLIVSKKLYFRAIGARRETIIEGAPDPSSGTYGPNGIRCVYVAPGGYDSEFHNLTFRHGASHDTGSDTAGCARWGGCVHVYGAKTRSRTADVHRAYFVDCDFVEGYAVWGAGLNGGTAIRCLFTGCQGASFGCSASGAALWNCVIFAGVNRSADVRPQVGNASLTVNCTIYGCSSSGADRDAAVYNTYFANLSGKEMVVNASNPCYYTNCVSGAATGQYQLLGPACGDFRPMAGAPIVDGGRTCYLTDVIKLPADTAMTDFNGNPLDLTREACNVGAVQGPGVTPGTGRIVFPANAEVEGIKNLRVSYAYAESFPAFTYYKPAGANYFRTKLEGFLGGTSAFRYPTPEGKVHFCYPPCVQDVLTLTDLTVARELWTDPTADADTADGTEAHPFRTLQAAMEHIKSVGPNDNTIVHARPGVYAEGSADLNATPCRVVVPGGPVIIRSTDGAAATMIRGQAAALSAQPFPEGYPGCGSDAIRCVGSIGGANAMIQGFTLADGHSKAESYAKDVATDRGGAVDSPDGYQLQVLDCVITNCSSVRSTVHGGWLQRCRIYDCQGYGGVTRYSNLTACFVDLSCKLGQGGPGANANCVVGTGTHLQLSTAPVSGPANSNRTYPFHLSSVLQLPTLYADYTYWGCVSQPIDASGNDTIDPCGVSYVDAAHGDYRLAGNSRAALGGRFPDRASPAWGTWATNFAAHISCDINGRPVRLNADGRPMAGCWQDVVPVAWVGAEHGGVAVLGGTLGANMLAAGGSLTITLDGSLARPCAGYVVNGVTNAYEVGQTVTWTADEVASNGGCSFELLYAHDWYVDAVRGSDANTGCLPQAPKKTLQGVLGSSALTAGDVVHAAPGVYDEGQGRVGTVYAFARAVVPAGVTLVSDAGAEQTIIVGAPDLSESQVQDGLGSNAVRCVYLAGKESMVRGFTLTGGYTDYYDTAKYENDWALPICGGGVLGHGAGRDNAYAYDCIISNNHAYTAGGVRFVNAVRCRLFENYALSHGGNAREANLWGTVADRARSKTAGVYSFTRLAFCTFGAGDRNYAGTASIAALSGVSSGIASISNCLVLGSCGGAGAMTIPAYNTVFAKGIGGLSADKVDADSCFIGVGGDEVAVDAELRPIPGANPAIDRGDVANFPPFLPKDLDASTFQRVMNAHVDVGALEGDWRPLYATDLSTSSRLKVTAASAGAVETDAHAVALTDGETLAATFLNPSGRSTTYRLVARLSAPGTLTVTCNGEMVQEVTTVGETEVLFRSASATNDLVFAFEGAGKAELLEVNRLPGFSINIR
ncbi:MAG: DUF1565 domain-containing protein [Kiritimatiellae bacterium]|nr:DUF1565 domain-containing protein [Kiritimatiellia bacterium]